MRFEGSFDLLTDVNYQENIAALLSLPRE